MNSQMSSSASAGTRVGQAMALPRSGTATLSRPASAALRSGVIPPLATGFATRPESAAGLIEALQPGTVVAITPSQSGPVTAPDWRGSCGKTQLAVWLAQSLWQAQELDLLVWITATSRAAIVSGYTAAMDVIGINSPGDAEVAAARFARWLSLSDQSWLVVLDGLADLADMSGLWPAGPNGRTLITTHNMAISEHEMVHTFPISGLSRREAMTFLMARLTGDWEQRAGAVDLVDHLDGEPLALAQAGAILGNSAMSCRDYIDLFARKRDQFTASGHATPATAAITWTISAEIAGSLPPEGPAQAMLMLAALLDGRRIPGTVFVTSAAQAYGGRGAAGGPATPESAWAGVVSLEQAGLVTIDPAVTPPVVRMDQAVQSVIKLATPIDALNYAISAAVSALIEAWPDSDHDAWLADSLRSCAASVRQLAGDRLWASGHSLLFRVGESLDAARLTGLAVAHWGELVEAATRFLAPTHPDALVAADKLAAALLAAGRAGDAVAWLQRVMAMRTGQFGSEHPATIAVQLNLGRALLAAGQPGDAIKILDPAVDRCEHAFGAEDVRTLQAIEALAEACLTARHLPDAVRLYQRAFAEYERIDGASAIATLDAGQKLGDAYLAADRVKDALASYKRVVSRREKAQRPDHRDTIMARGKLASAYQAAGKMVIALQEYERCRKDAERVLGLDHPDTLAYSVSLANVYHTVGRIGHAAALLRDTLERADRVLLPDDPLHKAARESLANITRLFRPERRVPLALPPDLEERRLEHETRDEQQDDAQRDDADQRPVHSRSHGG